MAKTGRLFCAGGSNFSFLFSGYQYRVFEPSTQRSCCCTFKSFNTMHFVITHRMDDVFYAMQLFFLLHLSSSHTIYFLHCFLIYVLVFLSFFNFNADWLLCYGLSYHWIMKKRIVKSFFSLVAFINLSPHTQN